MGLGFPAALLSVFWPPHHFAVFVASWVCKEAGLFCLLFSGYSFFKLCITVWDECTVVGCIVIGIEKESFSYVLQGDNIKTARRNRSRHRARNKRGSRARASKDTSKLLLLYDEDILDRDPLREQKDLAFAQAYLTRVGKQLIF